MMKPGVTGRALFETPERRSRLWLSRMWAPERGFALFCGLNPSKADEEKDDMTVTKGMEFSRIWQLGGSVYVNAYPFVSTKPSDLVKCTEYEIAHSDRWVVEFAKTAKMVVAAWGSFPKHAARFKAVSELLAPFKPICLGTTKDGYPKHISRLAYATPFRSWEQPAGQNDIKCQFCEALADKSKWKDDKCPKCGRTYDAILAQEGDD